MIDLELSQYHGAHQEELSNFNFEMAELHRKTSSNFFSDSKRSKRNKADTIRLIPTACLPESLSNLSSQSLTEVASLSRHLSASGTFLQQKTQDSQE